MIFSEYCRYLCCNWYMAVLVFFFSEKNIVSERAEQCWKYNPNCMILNLINQTLVSLLKYNNLRTTFVYRKLKMYSILPEFFCMWRPFLAFSFVLRILTKKVIETACYLWNNLWLAIILMLFNFIDNIFVLLVI